jgi:Rrf2 family protein
MLDVDISAKSDYAIRAMLVLAQEQAGDDQPVPAEVLAEGQHLPRKFLEAILADLRRASLVVSVRGAAGGYRLARPASTITLGAVMRVVDGPLAEVRGLRPHETTYQGAASHLPVIWVAVRASLRRVLDEVDLGQVRTGRLPAHVRKLAEAPDAWANR